MKRFLSVILCFVLLFSASMVSADETTVKMWSVRFWACTSESHEQFVVKEEWVPDGGSATPPSIVYVPEGYTFEGWIQSYSNITNHTSINADYQPIYVPPTRPPTATPRPTPTPTPTRVPETKPATTTEQTTVLPTDTIMTTTPITESSMIPATEETDRTAIDSKTPEETTVPETASVVTETERSRTGNAKDESAGAEFDPLIPVWIGVAILIIVAIHFFVRMRRKKKKE